MLILHNIFDKDRKKMFLSLLVSPLSDDDSINVPPICAPIYI